MDRSHYRRRPIPGRWWWRRWLVAARVAAGGAGGFLTGTTGVTAGTGYAVAVGSGGLGGSGYNPPNNDNPGRNGGNSQFGSLIALAEAEPGRATDSRLSRNPEKPAVPAAAPLTAGTLPGLAVPP